MSSLGNDLVPSVSVNATDVVDSRGWMDTQVFVCVDDVSAATETQMFAGSMKVGDRYGLLPAMPNGMLPFSGFLILRYQMMNVLSRSYLSLIVTGCCLFIGVLI